MRTVKIAGKRIDVKPKTVRLRVGDVEHLDTIYKDIGGANNVIRLLVAAHVDGIRIKAAQALGDDVQATHSPLTSALDIRAMAEDSTDE